MRLVLAALFTLLATPAFGQGGPDAFGYTWDATELDFVPLENGLGTGLGMTVQGEVDIVLPWAFPFYGNTYSAARVGGNGGVVFLAGAQISNYGCLAWQSSLEAPDIAIWWDQLRYYSPADVYTWHDTAQDRFVISWEQVEYTSNTAGAWFQMHLHPSGAIEFHYDWTGFNADAGWGGTASIGIQDWTGGTFASGNLLEMSCNDQVVARTGQA